MGIRFALFLLVALAAVPASAFSSYMEIGYYGELEVGSASEGDTYRFDYDLSTQPFLSESLCANNSGLTSACTAADLTEGAELRLEADLPFDFGFQSYDGSESYDGSISVHNSVGQTNIDNAKTDLLFSYHLSIDQSFRLDYSVVGNVVSLGTDCLAGWRIDGSLFDQGFVSGNCADGPVVITGSKVFAANESLNLDFQTLAYNGIGLDAPGLASDMTMNFTITAVPVPAAIWLFGSCLGLLGWFRRRQTS